MSSLRIQLELCHISNDDLIIYSKSTVISQTIIDGTYYIFFKDKPLILI